MSTHNICFRQESEALLMSTHNICFRREIRKILCGYPLLSVAMDTSKVSLNYSKTQMTRTPLPDSNQFFETLGNSITKTRLYKVDHP